MKALTILLPEPVNQLVLGQAARRGVDPTGLCSGIIAEYFLQARKIPAVSTNKHPATTAAPPNRPEPSEKFSVKNDVRKLFSNYPTRSVELAEQFVGEALKMPGAMAFKAFSGRGIGIEPNFVFVEYLQKSDPGGIGVSFYGRPEDHLHLNLLRPGRNPNYSRSIVCTHEGLKPLLEEIRRAHELKFGRVR